MVTVIMYLVSASVAVVGGREDGDNIPVVGPVVPLHHQLVGSDTLNTSFMKVL